jgi:uncharacterized membrane protein
MKSVILFLFIAMCVYSILCTPVSAHDENLLIFNMYKVIHTGYLGVRVGLLFAAPCMNPDDSAWMYDYFSLECHQLAERSFFINGRPMPLCARCTGIAVGSLVGNLSYYFLKDFYFNTIYAEYNVLAAIGIIFLGMLPLVIDGSLQMLSNYKSNNPLRLGTGILFGISLTFLFDIWTLSINRLINYLFVSYD